MTQHHASRIRLVWHVVRCTTQDGRRPRALRIPMVWLGIRWTR